MTQLFLVPLIVLLQAIANPFVVVAVVVNKRVKEVQQMALAQRPNCCLSLCRGLGTFCLAFVALGIGMYGIPFFAVAAFFIFLSNFIT